MGFDKILEVLEGRLVQEEGRPIVGSAQYS